MMTINPAELAPFLTNLAEAAAAETLPRFRQGLDITNKQKDGFDPVTEADRMAEKAIRALILERYPDHNILGEEWGETHGIAPYRWVIDPIDGTRAFICGVPVWTTLIGVECHGRLIAGLIDQPFTRERWIGGDGHTAIYSCHGNTQPARTSACTALRDARVMITDVRPDAYFTADESTAIHLLANQCKLLRQGLDSYGFGLVALGQMDLVIEAGLSWYDIAGVIPVIEAAGGTVTDWSGTPIKQPFGRGQVIVAATAALASQAASCLRPC